MDRCDKGYRYFFDGLFMYLEEFDLSERLIRHHYKSLYLPQLSFLHKVGKRNKISFNEHLWKIGADSHFYICKKFGLSPNVGFLSVNIRLINFFIYFCCRLHFKNAMSVMRTLIYRYSKLVKYYENK